MKKITALKFDANLTDNKRHAVSIVLKYSAAPQKIELEQSVPEI